MITRKGLGTTEIIMGLLMAVVLLSVLITTEVYAQPQQQQQGATAVLEMTGQQYFANGTGIAYFNDGSVIPFNHTITPEEGYYYDNSTAFIYGEPPGHEMNDTIAQMNDPALGGTLGSTGDIINVTIVSGAELLGERAIQPSNIIQAKVGDIMIWHNDDFTIHNILSPPSSTPSGAVPYGENFSLFLLPGQNATIAFTRPAGLHYEDGYNSDIKGAIIVEER